MMTDFHTHTPASDALVSSGAENFGRAQLESLEFHPWNVPDDFSGLPARFLELAPRAAAIGEAGLDRLRGAPFELQRSALQKILALANTLEKPVVFHAVRATPELFALSSPYPAMRKLIHGFRGSPAKFAEFRRHGFFVSFAPDALDSAPLRNAVLTDKLAGIGFESDDSAEPFAAIFRRNAARLGIGETELARITRQTFEEFLYGNL